jgi:4-diphosphocytidyl-2-C-methyl-D-erythritol kinase
MTSSSMLPVTIRAHAKINLDLRVLGMRPDGFHELRTVFQAISLYDTIRCIPREGPFAIECNVAGVPLDKSNLIWRAAEELWRSLRRSGPVGDAVVQLEKQIPLQAGLGGGSSDAAAVLMALTRGGCRSGPRSSPTWPRISVRTFPSFSLAEPRSGSGAATRSIRLPISRVIGSSC